MLTTPAGPKFVKNDGQSGAKSGDHTHANVKVVQRLLGHATAAMTLDRYGHLLNDDLSGVADALGKAVDSIAVSLRYPARQRKAGTALTMR